MEANAFVGRKTKPSESQLKEALGASKAMWDQVIDELEDECPIKEWSSYSPKGWMVTEA
jgi:hypothetical protein